MESKKKEIEICRYLKAKNTFGMLEGGDTRWSGIDDANTQFWCVKTGDATGPDDGLAGAAECGPWRKCFQSR